jgi:chromosome segregation ATPase
MPTQEERLATLEQSQANFGDSINDLNHHVTILIGIIQKQEWDIREIKNSLRAIDGRLSSFDNRLGSFDSRLSSFDGRLGSFDSRLSSLDGRLSSFEQSVNSRFETQDKKLDQIMGLLTTLTTKSEQQT